MKKVFLFCLIFLSCCTAQNKMITKKISLSLYQGKLEAKLHLPGSPDKTSLFVYGNRNSQYIYIYIYSGAYLYVNNDVLESSPNSKNIEKLQTEESEIRIQNWGFVKEYNRGLIYYPDLPPMEELPYGFEFSGTDENGLHWRDIWLDGFSIGYIHVPEDKKAQFDRSLESFEIIKIIPSEY